MVYMMELILLLYYKWGLKNLFGNTEYNITNMGIVVNGYKCLAFYIDLKNKKKKRSYIRSRLKCGSESSGKTTTTINETKELWTIR